MFLKMAVRNQSVIGFLVIFQVFKECKVKDFDVNQFTTEQVFYQSKDGTKIPMFIVHKKVSIWKLNKSVRILTIRII